MTNSDIIYNARVNLMENGVIGGTFSGVGIDADGNNYDIYTPEEINTYAAWKSRGYQVRRGERAIAKIDIWIYNNKAKKNAPAEDEEKDDNAKKSAGFFLRKSAFFSRSQVQPIEAEA